jgi:hypothetical protein
MVPEAAAVSAEEEVVAMDEEASEDQLPMEWAIPDLVTRCPLLTCMRLCPTVGDILLSKATVALLKV